MFNIVSVFIGTMELGNKLDVTDPCYDRGDYDFLTTECQPGTYKGYATIADCGDWGLRVSRIAIYREDVDPKINYFDEIGVIGVDAGLAGFFNQKPDYDDKAWHEFCNKMKKGDVYWNIDCGLYSSSGYGDGMYSVYANDDRTAFMIEFIEEDDNEDY